MIQNAHPPLFDEQGRARTQAVWTGRVGVSARRWLEVAFRFPIRHWQPKWNDRLPGIVIVNNIRNAKSRTSAKIFKATGPGPVKQDGRGLKGQNLKYRLNGWRRGWVMADLVNFVMLIAASIGSMALGVLAAYGVLRVAFAWMRLQKKRVVHVSPIIELEPNAHEPASFS